MIELKDLTTYYGERILLSDASALFAEGALIALIGRNGTGKSTLLRAMAGLNKVYRGEIRINGEPLMGMSANERACNIAFVMTERTRIPGFRCRDVVSMGRAPYNGWTGSLSAEDRRIVVDALEAVGMRDYADREMQTMSDGECQKIMIARALAQNTPNILFDEPTSFLDMPGRFLLVELLGELAHEKRKTIIFSTHELDLAVNTTDSVALIEEQRLIHLPSQDMKDFLPGTGLIPEQALRFFL